MKLEKSETGGTKRALFIPRDVMDPYRPREEKCLISTVYLLAENRVFCPALGKKYWVKKTFTLLKSEIVEFSVFFCHAEKGSTVVTKYGNALPGNSYRKLHF